MVYQAVDFLSRLAKARPHVLRGGGEAALQAFFPNRLSVDWDIRAWPPQFSPLMAGWIDTVMRRREQLGEPLRRTLVSMVEQAEADATTPDAEIPRILMQFAQSLPDRAHDIYQDKDAPIAWNDVADAATIAALQMPDGFGSGDVFPSSVSVARSVAAAFVAARGSRG